MLQPLALILLGVAVQVASKCPEQCLCDIDGQGRKRVTCNYGGMTEIPTRKMDAGIKVLVVTAPTGNPNKLTIGRIFQDFGDLEEVRITRSTLPAIGDGSFWPGKNMKTLDLSYNNISFVRDRDFFGLQNLKVLDLSYNNIAASPSAPFRLLASLTSLSLARNRLKSLVPRFFYMLDKLEKLDLTGNPLKEVDPENLRDIRSLRRLHLAKCQLGKLHSLTYQQLPNLEELDLRENRFVHFSPEEFRHLKRLKYLHLDGNNLTTVAEKTFDGHSLRHLGLSRNRLSRLSKCAFCNLSLQQLDLSHNQLEILSYDALSTLAHSLESLDLGFNPLDPTELELVLGSVYKLKRLSLSGVGIRELSLDAFFGNRQLRALDLSHNALGNLSAQTFSPLRHVEEIDLSHNDLRSLEPDLLDQLSNLSRLSVLHLHANPWSCQRCAVLPLLRWLKDSPLYSSTCDVHYESSTCMRCAAPAHLEGRTLHSLRPGDLEPCEEVSPQSQVLRTSTDIHLIVISSAVAVVALGVVLGVVFYTRQGAVYYTKEEERVPSVMGISGEYVVTNGGLAGDTLRRAYFLALDRMDDEKTGTIRLAS